jgi:transcriptional regulator
MEVGRDNAWRVEDMGERYQNLAGHITAFDAAVRSVDATFKLGQDEKPVIFENILSGLDHPELEKWMRRFAGRNKGA